MATREEMADWSLSELLDRIAELQAKLDIAHNWVLDNQVHSCSYNQFVKALEQKDYE